MTGYSIKDLAARDVRYLQLAIDIAAESVSSGGGPFGAVIVTPPGNLYTGSDRVLLTNDPTAHAEVDAIRLATAAEETYDLSGSVLYSSCAPCPMCLTAALWARIPRILYAGTSEQATAAGFDDAAFYRQISGGFSTVTDAEIHHLNLNDANKPFEVWDAYEGKISF